MRVPLRGSLLDGHVPGTSAYATFPVRLCLRNKNLHCSLICLRTLSRTAKHPVNSRHSFIRTSLEYIKLVIQEKNAQSFWILSSQATPSHSPFSPAAPGLIAQFQPFLQNIGSQNFFHLLESLQEIADCEPGQLPAIFF